MKEKKINRDWKVFEWSYFFFAIAALMGWTLFLWYKGGITTLEWVVDRQQNIIQELRQVDKEKCVDLFLNDKI